MNKNLTIKMGNCNHRRSYATLVDLVRSGVVDPVKILTKVEPLRSTPTRRSTGESGAGSRWS